MIGTPVTLEIYGIVREERARIETAFDRKLFAVGAQGDRDAFVDRAAAAGYTGYKGIGFAPQSQQPFDVRFRYGQLFFEREAFRKIPFSAIRPLPAKTTSVEDSPNPAELYR